MRIAQIISFVGLSLLLSARAMGQPVPIPNLEEALRIAETESPRTHAAIAKRTAAAGALRQAEARLNPEIFIDAGRHGASDQVGDGYEITAGLAQKVELAGKRQARVQAAEVGQIIAEQDRVIDRLNLRQDVAEAYVQMLYLGRLVRVDTDTLRRTSELAEQVRKRIAVEREVPIQLRNVQIVASRVEVGKSKAERDHEGAAAYLKALLAIDDREIAPNQAWFDNVSGSPEATIDFAVIVQNPELVRLRVLVDKARVGVAQEEASQIPDPVIRAGVRRHADNSASAVVGFSVPIPVYDRNSGALLQARQNLLRAEAEAEAGEQLLRGQLARARQVLAGAFGEVRGLNQTLADAEEILTAAEERYVSGAYSLPEVLRALEVQSDIARRRAMAVRDYHLARLSYMRLTGRTY